MKLAMIKINKILPYVANYRNKLCLFMHEVGMLIILEIPDFRRKLLKFPIRGLIPSDSAENRFEWFFEFEILSQQFLYHKITNIMLILKTSIINYSFCSKISQ